MIAFGHSSSGVIVGGGVAVVAHQAHVPLLLSLMAAFTIGVLAHYVGDIIPHGHYRFGVHYLTPKSILLFSLDFFGALLLLLLLLYHFIGLGTELLIILSAIAGAQAPDLFEAAVDLKLIPKTPFTRAHRHFHYKILHWHNETTSQLPGHGRPLRLIDLWQVGVFVLSLWLIIHLPKY